MAAQHLAPVGPQEFRERFGFEPRTCRLVRSRIELELRRFKMEIDSFESGMIETEHYIHYGALANHHVGAWEAWVDEVYQLISSLDQPAPDEDVENLLHQIEVLQDDFNLFESFMEGSLWWDDCKPIVEHYLSHWRADFVVDLRTLIIQLAVAACNCFAQSTDSTAGAA